MVLTGSRFFGYANKDSDWDYFEQDSLQIRQQLIDNKFVQLIEYIAPDTEFKAHFKSDDGKIDIILVRDIKKIATLQWHIKQSGLGKAMHYRELAPHIWRLCSRLVCNQV